jgi:hypothetical protein
VLKHSKQVLFILTLLLALPRFDTKEILQQLTTVYPHGLSEPYHQAKSWREALSSLYCIVSLLLFLLDSAELQSSPLKEVRAFLHKSCSKQSRPEDARTTFVFNYPHNK